MPFLLDVSSCSIHIQFLLDLCVFAVLSFLVLAISFLPIFLLLLTFGCKISHVMSCLFLHALDLLFILHKLSNLSFLQSVSLVGLLFNNGLLLPPRNPPRPRYRRVHRPKDDHLARVPGSGRGTALDRCVLCGHHLLVQYL